MRICFITHYTNLHGANRSLLDLIEGLGHYGMRSIVFCPKKGEITEELERRKVEYAVFPFAYWMSGGKDHSFLRIIYRLFLNIIILPWMIIKTRKEKIDLIYSNSSCTPIGFFISKMTGIPHFWHVREFGFDDFELKHDLGKYIFEFCFQNSQGIIAVSKAIRWEVLGRINKKVHIVYNGVFDAKLSTKYKDKRKKRISKRDFFTFCSIGQISNKKNQAEAIKAFALLKEKYKDIKLIIAGYNKNRYGEKLHVLCRDLGVENSVIFSGYIKDPLNFLYEADVLLNCSTYEAMGRVTAEAMATCMPVIGFRNAGTAEIIDDGIDGILYKNGYIELAEKMESLLIDIEKEYRLGQAGQEKAVSLFSIQVYSEKIKNIILESVGKN